MIPDSVKMGGTMRALTMTHLDKMHDRIEQARGHHFLNQPRIITINGCSEISMSFGVLLTGSESTVETLSAHFILSTVLTARFHRFANKCW